MLRLIPSILTELLIETKSLEIRRAKFFKDDGLSGFRKIFRLYKEIINMAKLIVVNPRPKRKPLILEIVIGATFSIIAVSGIKTQPPMSIHLKAIMFTAGLLQSFCVSGDLPTIPSYTEVFQGFTRKLELRAIKSFSQRSWSLSPEF